MSTYTPSKLQQAAAYMMVKMLDLGVCRQMWTVGTGLGKSRIIGALVNLVQCCDELEFS